MGAIKKMIEEDIPGIDVQSLMIGNNVIQVISPSPGSVYLSFLFLFILLQWVSAQSSVVSGYLNKLTCTYDLYKTRDYWTFTFSRRSSPKRLTVSTGTFTSRVKCLAQRHSVNFAQPRKPATFWLVARFSNHSAIWLPQSRVYVLAKASHTLPTVVKDQTPPNIASLSPSRTQRMVSFWTWIHRFPWCAANWPRIPGWRMAIMPWVSPRGGSFCEWISIIRVWSKCKTVRDKGPVYID